MVFYCPSCGNEVAHEGEICNKCRKKLEVQKIETETLDIIKDLLEDEEKEDEAEKPAPVTGEPSYPVIPVTGEYGFGILELQEDIVKLTQRDDLEINVTQQGFKIEDWKTMGRILIINPSFKKIIPLLSLRFYSVESVGERNCYEITVFPKTSRLNIGYLLVPGYSFVRFSDAQVSNGIITLNSIESFHEIESQLAHNVKPLEFNYTFDEKKLTQMIHNSLTAPNIANLLFTIDGKFKWEIPISIKVLLAESVQPIEEAYGKARHEFILRLAEISALIEKTITNGKIRHWDKNLNFEVYEKNYYKEVRPLFDEWLYKKQEFLHNLEKLADYYSIFVILENRSSEQLWPKDFYFEEISIEFPPNIRSIDPKSISSLTINTSDGSYVSHSEVYDPIQNKLAWKNFSLKSNSQEDHPESPSPIEAILKPSTIQLCFQIKKSVLAELDHFTLELRGTYSGNVLQIIDEVYFISPMGFPISQVKVGNDFRGWKVPQVKVGDGCGTFLKDRLVPQTTPLKTDQAYGFHFRYKITPEKILTEFLQFSKEELELKGMHCDDVYEILRDVLIKQGAKITWEQWPLELIHSNVIGLKQYFGEILVTFEFQEGGSSYFDIEIRGEGKRAGITGLQEVKKQRSKVVFRIRSKREAKPQIDQILTTIRERLTNFLETKLKFISEED